MMLLRFNARLLAAIALAAAAVLFQMFGGDVSALVHHNPDIALSLTGLAFVGETTLADVKQQLLEMAREHKTAVESATGDVKTMRQDLLELQQKMVSLHQKSGGPIIATRDEGQLAELFTKAVDGMKRNVDKKVRIELPAGALHLDAKSVVNAPGLNQPLVPGDRRGFIVTPPERRLFMRDVLPVFATPSNMIEYARETAFTNNAAIVANSPNVEDVAKPQSDFTFELKNAAVQTIAHYVRASRQVLDDSMSLLGYLDNRLSYGLKLAEQDEILNGDGTTGHLDGLMHQATAYAGSGAVSADTQIDTIRRAIAQLEVLEFTPSAIVVNPIDWMKMSLLKDSQGRYILGGPASDQAQSMFNVPVIVTNQIAATRFMVGDMSMAAAIFDRQAAILQLSEHDADNFTKNMVTIRVENRMTLCVLRPAALVRGNF